MGRREEVVEVVEGLPEVFHWFFSITVFEILWFLFNSLSRWWWEEKKGWFCPKEVLISSQIKADKSKCHQDLYIDFTFSRPLQCSNISRSGSLHPSSRRVDLNPEPQTSSTRGSHSQVKRLLNISTRKASKISQVSRGSKSSKTSDKEKSDVEVRVVPDTLLVSISPDLVSAVIVRSLFVVFEKKHQIQKKVCSWTWNQGLNIEVAVYWRGRGRGNSSTIQCHLKPFNYRHIFFFFLHPLCQSHHQVYC